MQSLEIMILPLIKSTSITLKIEAWCGCGLSSLRVVWDRIYLKIGLKFGAIAKTKRK